MDCSDSFNHISPVFKVTNVMESSDFENHAQYTSTEEIANLAGVKEGHMPSRSSTRKCACCKFRDNPRVK